MITKPIFIYLSILNGLNEIRHLENNANNANNLTTQEADELMDIIETSTDSKQLISNIEKFYREIRHKKINRTHK